MDDAFAERALERRRTMTAHVARSRAEVASFERERDASLPPHERAEAIWRLVCEMEAIRGAMEPNSDSIDLSRALNDADPRSDRRHC